MNEHYYRVSIRCENGHEFVSTPDLERHVERQLAYFAEDGGCRCGSTLAIVFRYEVDKRGRSGPLVKLRDQHE